jgi:hypothetical protein
MSDLSKTSRRQFLKIGGAALVAIPALGIATSAFAAQNAEVRKALGYQTSPKDGKQCSKCVNYKPDVKGCNLFPGDTEIVPNGYCSGFVAKT